MSVFCNIFDQTLKRYRIKAVTLSERSGVSTSLISDFRKNRKSTTTETLEKLLTAMDEIAPGSRSYFHQQMAGAEDLIDLVSTMPDEQLAILIDRVADRLRSGVGSEGKIGHPSEQTLIGA